VTTTIRPSKYITGVPFECADWLKVSAAKTKSMVDSFIFVDVNSSGDGRQKAQKTKRGPRLFFCAFCAFSRPIPMGA